MRDEGKTAYLRPTRELIYNYIDLSQPSIFVKPLITESPVQDCSGILVPTLEKLLVDLQKDKDFFYLQEAEGVNIFQNALSLYSINESRLLRYASRRGIRKETWIMTTEKKMRTSATAWRTLSVILQKKHKI